MRMGPQGPVIHHSCRYRHDVVLGAVSVIEYDIEQDESEIQYVEVYHIVDLVHDDLVDESEEISCQHDVGEQDALTFSPLRS